MPHKVSQQSVDALAQGTGGNVVAPCPKAAAPAPQPTVATGHILKGEINKNGKAVGFHHRAGGNNPPGSHMGQVNKGPNKAGVYEGSVQIYNAKTQAWVPKPGGSSFYPESMSEAEIEQAILAAAKDAEANGEVKPNGKFVGDSGKGFKIGGYMQNGKIATAYPIFKAD